MDSEERKFIDTSLTAKPGEAIFDLVDPDPVGEGEERLDYDSWVECTDCGWSLADLERDGVPIPGDEQYNESSRCPRCGEPMERVVPFRKADAMLAASHQRIEEAESRATDAEADAEAQRQAHRLTLGGMKIVADRCEAAEAERDRLREALDRIVALKDGPDRAYFPADLGNCKRSCEGNNYDVSWGRIEWALKDADAIARSALQDEAKGSE